MRFLYLYTPLTGYRRLILEVILKKKKGRGGTLSQGIGEVGKKGLVPGSGGLISFDCAGPDLRSIQLLLLKLLEAYEAR